MMEQYSGPVGAPRFPFAQEVRVRFEDFGEFVTRISRNLSLTGMFLRTDRPHPPGTGFEFEFGVAGGDKLIRGFGEVVWTRQPGGGKDRPPGMGIRFVSLDEPSRRLIHWLIDHGLSPAEPGVQAAEPGPGPAG